MRSCVFAIAGFGVMIAFGSKMAGLFAHPAEARFIVGSPATPFIATLYIQARDILVTSARRGIALLWAALVYLPDGLSAGAFARDVALVLSAFTVIAAVPLARQMLAQRFVPYAVATGIGIAVAAAVPAVRDFAVIIEPTAPYGTGLYALPAVHPGALLLGSAGLQWTALGVLAVMLAALFLFVARRARDAYPELYELSMNRLQRTERLRSRMFAGRPARLASSALVTSKTISAPPGIAIFLWRAWTEYRRSNGPRATAIETAGMLGVSYAAARFTGTDMMRLLPVATTLATMLFIVALARSAALATELRRPLFWLSPATLFERLCGLALAHSWRLTSWFVLISIGLAAGRAPVLAIASTLVAGPAAVVLAVAVGYFSYALLPQDIDQRGPMMFVRVLIGYVAVVPAIAGGIAIGVFTHAALPGIIAGGAGALAETLLLIGISAGRLGRMSIPLR